MAQDEYGNKGMPLEKAVEIFEKHGAYIVANGDFRNPRDYVLPSGAELNREIARYGTEFENAEQIVDACNTGRIKPKRFVKYYELVTPEALATFAKLVRD
jgi:hypothetical protein